MVEPSRSSGSGGLGSVWHGHVLRPLPDGESWLSGGERRVRIPATSSDPAAAPAPPANERRTLALLCLVSAASLATIVLARPSGTPPEPAPLPAPPSHTITAVSRAHAATVSIRVGEYLQFQLPAGRTYSTVLEQPSGQVPVVEALTLPGQQPQLRADSAGHAVIEVMSAPACDNPEGCPDQRTLLGRVDVTVAA